ncbi:MAG: S8 family serine peptidase [Nocardioides sp.]
MLRQSRYRSQGLAVLAAVATTAALGVALPSQAAPDGERPAAKARISSGKALAGSKKLSAGLDRDKQARQEVFVRFGGDGAAATAEGTSSKRAARLAAGERADDVESQARDAVADAKGADSDARRLFTVSNAVPGVGVEVDGDGIAALAARSDVVKISRIYPKKPANANAANLIRAINAWKYAGGTGKGVKVGVVDSGVDYTHAGFGGVGTPEAYEAALAAETDPNWRDGLPELGKAKIADGYDFAGNDYDADPDSENYQPVPKPDPNPIDCEEHGTHVAGTATGYGVTEDGKPFTGDYAGLTPAEVLDMKVGPGMAPESTLYPLKIFGCTGSTNLVIPALDWSLDPNGDGDFSDHLDIVNMSLGSDYGVVDDPENDVVDALHAQGVLSVVAMGNNGDLTDTGGSPGNAESSLAVASSVDSYQLRDGLIVDGPTDVAGIEPGQFSTEYDWPANGPTGAPVSGEVAAIPGDNADGCDALSAADAAKVNGKVAWLEWDDDDATRRCGSAGRSGNVAAAGAVGAVFTSSSDVFGAGILGSAQIPVFQLPATGTDKLRPAAEGGTLTVTFDGAQQATVRDIDPSLTDTVSGFSSRGTHGSLGVVKPDVAAPGDTIASVKSGSGDGVLSISGTSMAAPMAAGVAALVKATHPGWTPTQIKAAVMNTAVHDLWTKPGRKGLRYAPARVGAGRINAKYAVSTDVLAYVKGPRGPVSASFGVVPARVGRGPVVKTKRVTIANVGDSAARVRLAYQSVNSSPGVRYTVSPREVVVGAKRSRVVRVTMRVSPQALRHTIDPTMEATQLGAPRQFVSDSSGRLLVKPAGKRALRVPVYGAAKPVSATRAQVDGSDIVVRGTGIDQGTSSGAYVSLASVMEFGASSGVLPECTTDQLTGCASTVSEKAGDLKYVGAGSSGDLLWFGLATRADWATVGNSMTPYVDFDTSGDGEPDFETFVQNATGTDVLVATTVDLASGDIVDLQPVNFNFGDVDTNVFDTNVIMLPVSKELIGLPATGSAEISYVAATFSGYTGADIDRLEPVAFDAGAPAVTTEAPLYIDAGKTRIDVTTSGPAKALVFHLHGGKRARAQVLSFR